MREEREALRLPVHYPLTISHYPYSWREWCRGTESNCRHQPFQGCALPTELPRHIVWFGQEMRTSGLLCVAGSGVKIKRRDRVGTCKSSLQVCRYRTASWRHSRDELWAW